MYRLLLLCLAATSIALGADSNQSSMVRRSRRWKDRAHMQVLPGGGLKAAREGLVGSIPEGRQRKVHNRKSSNVVEKRGNDFDDEEQHPRGAGSPTALARTQQWQTPSSPGQWSWHNLRNSILEHGEQARSWVSGVLSNFSSGAAERILQGDDIGIALCAIWGGISLVFLSSMAGQSNSGKFREIQALKRRLLMALLMLSIFGTLTSLTPRRWLSRMALRYLVEGYLLYVVLYVVPATLGSHIDTAEAEEERKRKAKELAQTSISVTDSPGHTPALLLAALKQFENSEEEVLPEEPHKVTSTSTPRPIVFLFLLCFLRPALNVFDPFTNSHFEGHLTPERLIRITKACFVVNVCIILLGLMVARVPGRISKYVMWFPSISVVAKVLPILGASQDFALGMYYGPGGDGSGTMFAGLVYLFEVAMALFFTAFTVAPGKTLLEQLWGDEELCDEAQGTHWLMRVLDPRSERSPVFSVEALKGRQKAIRDQLLSRQKSIAERLRKGTPAEKDAHVKLFTSGAPGVEVSLS